MIKTISAIIVLTLIVALAIHHDNIDNIYGPGWVVLPKAESISIDTSGGVDAILGRLDSITNYYESKKRTD